jgi:hypothetical protein
MLLLWVCAGCGDEPGSPADSDGDNLSDADETKLGTDPFQIDSDFDGVTDYSDDVDGDGVSNAEEIEAGTAAPSKSSGARPSGTAGTTSDRDGTDDNAGADTDTGTSAGAGAGDAPGDGDAPADPPADQPADKPNEPAAGAASCDELWARCTKNLARACEAFVASCELPGCEDLKVACGAGSQPVCGFFERKCSNGAGTAGEGSSDGSSGEPAFCPDLRSACAAGSADACKLVERDCNPAFDCAGLELKCKAAGGVGEACDLLAAQCA